MGSPRDAPCTFQRLQEGCLKQTSPTDMDFYSTVDIEKLGHAEKQLLLGRLLQDTERDHKIFLCKLRERIDNVHVDLPKIEVRFENLNVEAIVQVGSRALPTLLNFTLDFIEGLFGFLFQPKRRKLHILKDISGIIRPSRLTLLLGPPSSGKTTLLLALAGKLSPVLEVSGNVMYNGHKMTEFVPPKTSTYVSPIDTHYVLMTVRETLDFGCWCQGVGSRHDLLVELSNREKEAGIKPDPDINAFMKAISVPGQKANIVAEYVMKILRLDTCADILVGDHMRRGISGGEKRRLTTGEMLVGPAECLFMDDISTGLDSSTTFHIVSCLQQMVHVMDNTVLMSLLQPAPETYELFDDIILLCEGHIVYQGPREHALDFFQSMGFTCPERKNPADFLQEVTSKKDQQQYWHNQLQPYRHVTVEQFAEAFKSYKIGQDLQQELVVPYIKSTSHPAALSTKTYGLPKWELFKACFSREVLTWKRNSFLYIFKTSQLSITAIITMAVFSRIKLDTNSVAGGVLYMGALFFGLMTIMYNGASEMLMVVNRLPVFYKQRDQLFYPAWAYTIPAIIIRAPLSILESLIWVCFTYFVIGFAPEPHRFFRQILLLFCVSQMALGMFRFLGSIARTLDVASSYGTFALMIVILMGGFLISREQIPGWWIWAYWSSPMAYALNALFVNEFLAPRWQKPYNGPINANTMGTAILKSRGFFTEDYWFWLGACALIGFAILFNVLYTLALTFLDSSGAPQAASLMLQVDEHASNGNNQSARIDEMNRISLGKEEISLYNVKQAPTKSFPLNEVEQGIKPQRKGMVLPFQPLCMAFHSINYYVDMPVGMKGPSVLKDRLQLLEDVSGTFRPGVLTALVGVSGAGKSTLMDVLAGRKTGGYIEGEITISGYPKKQETFARIAGYCEQNDIHSPNVTVKESLLYSAWLRLPKKIDKQLREMFVEEVMELLELTPFAEALVGLPGVKGLSTEQRKRLTIAVELVANPSIIFMDEPTSGLDARAAAIVMRTVRNTVDSGRTVVCTIHQPSIHIFESFDELLLLKRGGRVIYAGPLGHHSANLIEYFQAIPGNKPYQDGYNPATWMLDITSPSAEARLQVDFAQIYKHSARYQQNQALIKELSTPFPSHQDLSFPTRYPQIFVEQCLACLWKQHRSYWRNPNYNIVRMSFTIAIALLFGTVYWRTGRKMETTTDLSNFVGAIYGVSLFISFHNVTSVGPVVAVERTVFYRERGARMYSALSYAFAQAAIEIPYIFTQTIVYVVIVYSMIGFEWTATKFLYYFYFTFLTLVFTTYLGMSAVALTPDILLASMLTSTFVNLWNLFSGFTIPIVNMPVWWRWYYWTNPVAWSIYGLVASQVGDVESRVSDPDHGMTLTVKQYVEQAFGYRHDLLGAVAGVHIGLALLSLFVFALAITKLNFQKR